MAPIALPGRLGPELRHLHFDELCFFIVIPIFQTNEVPEVGIDANSVCDVCNEAAEPWVCLTCYKVHCGRYVHGHAVAHHLAEPTHAMSLSLADLTVWCYPCEAYVHNEVLVPAKSAAHLSKFGESYAQQ